LANALERARGESWDGCCIVRKAPDAAGLPERLSAVECVEFTPLLPRLDARGTAAALERNRVDVMRGVLDVAGFAVDAVLRVDDEAPISLPALVDVDHLMDGQSGASRRPAPPWRISTAFACV
jgi:hypothetical protein